MNALQPKTREAVLAIAAWQIGVTEAPANSNNVKYNTWYYGHAVSGSEYKWCMVFVQWVFHEAGFNLYKTASCGTLMNRYKQAKQWVTKDYKPGDIIIFDFPNTKYDTDHVGILESIDKDGNLITIEGNTGTGNDVNGGAVMRRVRPLKHVKGACRPMYNIG